VVEDLFSVLGECFLFSKKSTHYYEGSKIQDENYCGVTSDVFMECRKNTNQRTCLDTVGELIKHK
jgi:hypothetical protein